MNKVLLLLRLATLLLLTMWRIRLTVRLEPTLLYHDYFTLDMHLIILMHLILSANPCTIRHDKLFFPSLSKSHDLNHLESS